MQPNHDYVRATAFCLSFLACASISNAQITIEPAGFTTISSLGNSDTLVSIPFTRPPAFVGAIQSASGNTITVSGNPWSNDQFVYAPGSQPNRYYALIGPASSSNPKEGHTFLVTDNSTNTLTVDTTQDNLSGIAPNAELVLIPYWTLATLFPSTDRNISFTPTTSTQSLQTQVLLPDYSTVGTNLAYSATYFFLDTDANDGWRLLGDNLAIDHGDDILPPADYIAVRNENGAPTLPITFLGSVLTRKFAIALKTDSLQAQDNAVSMPRPVGVSLNDTGLTPSDGSFRATASTRNIQDQLFLYDNTQAAINKAPVARYFHFNGAWRIFGDDLATDHGSDPILVGHALLIRKAPTAGGETAFWSNAPTY